MNSREPQSPFNLLLLVTGRLGPGDLATFQSWVPFLERARWFAGRRIAGNGSRTQDAALDALVDSLVLQISDHSEIHPARIACFFMADWERMEVSSIEQVLSRLGTGFPQAKIEALLLDSGAERTVDLVLVAR